jgi:hypothetical protein
MAEQLKFYNLKTKKSFVTDNYVIKNRSNRRFAVAKKDGIECWRVVSKAKK